MQVVHFMGTGAGRAARVALGAALVVVGAVAGGAWWALSAVGLVPIAAGAFDFCLLAPVFRAPLRHRSHA
ncbi:MAG: DUF2892 domain-containing protein [Actinomycetota bacterium]|nr:DUF2892 domain-containing protein [Actinomycetota bacterium]